MTTSPCRAVLITSGPSWTASSASSRRTQRAKRQAWPTCASSSRTVSTRCSPQRSCTCWAKRARAPRSPPSTSASSSTGWFWRARLFVQVRQHNELLYYFHLFYINCERGWCLTPGVCRSSKSQNPGLKKSLVYKENKLLGIAVQLQLCDYGEKKKLQNRSCMEPVTTKLNCLTQTEFIRAHRAIVLFGLKWCSLINSYFKKSQVKIVC